MVYHCPNCGAEAEKGDRFCKFCGAPMGQNMESPAGTAGAPQQRKKAAPKGARPQPPAQRADQPAKHPTPEAVKQPSLPEVADPLADRPVVWYNPWVEQKETPTYFSATSGVSSTVPVAPPVPATRPVPKTAPLPKPAPLKFPTGAPISAALWEQMVGRIPMEEGAVRMVKKQSSR